MKLTEFIQDIGRPVTFYPGLKKITKSTTATLFICQFIYWTGKQADPEGWIYKTSDEIEEETGLTYDEQVTARKQLVRLGFLQEQYKRLEHRMTFRVLMDVIDEEWRKLKDGIPESRNTALGKAVSGDSLNESETTTENTTYIETKNFDLQEDEPEPDITQYRELSDKFTQITGILLYRNQEWNKAIEEMLANQITPDILDQAIQKLRGAKMTISGPWSVSKTAIGLRTEPPVLIFEVANG